MSNRPPGGSDMTSKGGDRERVSKHILHVKTVNLFATTQTGVQWRKGEENEVQMNHALAMIDNTL